MYYHKYDYQLDSLCIECVVLFNIERPRRNKLAFGMCTIRGIILFENISKIEGIGIIEHNTSSTENDVQLLVVPIQFSHIL